MSPDISIWLGSDENPGNLLDEELGDKLEDEGELEMDGLTFERFYFADNVAGFGVRLFAAGRYTVEPFDLDGIYEKKKEMLPKVTKIFKDWGIEDEPDVFFQIHVG